MSVSGRLSSCSTLPEDNDGRMFRTPRTPIKSGFQVTPRRSDRRKSLFQSCSPSRSDDLGLMVPLSPSSSSSNHSLDSPQFSPNGKFSTPPKTPGIHNDSAFHLVCKKIEIKSSLFPDLKVITPKYRRSPRTPKTVIPKVLTPDSQNSLPKCLSTPMRKFQRRELFSDLVVPETDSSPSLCSQDNFETVKEHMSELPTILGIKPLSCESFYGPTPTRENKARTQLFVDTLAHRAGSRSLIRSFSKESLSSNKSFVSGGTKKKREKRDSHPRSQSKSVGRENKRSAGRSRGLQAGVWHNIKKPKQIKKICSEKPLISPKSRISKMLRSSDVEIKVKEKSLFKDNSKRRIAHSKKRSRHEMEHDNNFDNTIKRKKAVSSQVDVHPAVCSPENILPDPNKKFCKFGQTRKATFTLNENVKLQITDGVMKLQTPKKRRKLYTRRKDWNEDFNDVNDDGYNLIQNSIEGILNILEDDKDVSVNEISEKPLPQGELESQLLDDTCGKKPTPRKKNERSPLKSVSNLPMLIINDFDSDEDENMDSDTIVEKKSSDEVTLEKTGNMVSYMTNILVNTDQEIINNSLNSENENFEENNIENSPPNKKKLYSLFYKQNWDKSLVNETDTTKSTTKKRNKYVPDDQYLLDAGQESIGIVTCKKCGVMYQAGDFADEATHLNFHNHLPELKFTGWNNERVVGRYSDGRVIMILNADPKVWWQKITKIVEIVDQELGFPKASVNSLFYKTVYLYINDKSKQICGCLIAEECKVAYKMYPPLEGVEIDSCSKDPSPCKVGISRIWTALSHRRKGVASRLIECLQKTFFFGEIVSLDQIAFSAPSPSGKLLAQKVTGKLDFLVYGFA